MKPTVGILGSGQLATFLAEAARRLGRSVRVFATSADDPAARVADDIVLQRSGDPEVASRFFSGLEVALFESENVDLSAFGEWTTKARFVPSLDAIRILQDKLRQKRLLRELALPASPFHPLAAGAAPGPWIRALDREFPKGWILKAARGGYDGKGNWLGSDPAEALAWTEGRVARGTEVYAEERVAIAEELAILGARTAAGEIGFYPAVVTRQASGTCDWAKGPATALGLERAVEDEMRATARAIAEKTGLVGAFAVEFFRSTAGELLVNEIAPRVHNSGHFTLDGARVSQFEQHLRAALGMELGSFETAPFFFMKNCLGPRGASYDRAGARPSREERGPVAYHDYGKVGVRSGRKLGHLTAVGELAARAAIEAEVMRAHDQWQKETIERSRG
jgi:5-(carboxyamino)imidazole ribonucleotide synthase